MTVTRRARASALAHAGSPLCRSHCVPAYRAGTPARRRVLAAETVLPDEPGKPRGRLDRRPPVTTDNEAGVVARDRGRMSKHSRSDARRDHGAGHAAGAAAKTDLPRLLITDGVFDGAPGRAGGAANQWRGGGQ
jgi:hypothetical protein